MNDATRNLTREDLARYIDHTILKPESARAQVLAVADEGIEFSVASVCVNPLWIPEVAARLEGSGVKACSVVGFPLGSTPAEVVAEEARRAIGEGAAEIDMVAPLGLVKTGAWEEVQGYLSVVREATGGTVLKVILETGALEDEEIVRLSRLCDDAGADFVKTSTGFHPSGGASEHAVRLMRDSVADSVGVKASGGIRSLAAATAMIDAGATRLGLSATSQILGELG